MVKIKILKVYSEDLCNIVGEVFDVIGENFGQYHIYHGGKKLFIFKENTEVVEDVDKSCVTCRYSESGHYRHEPCKSCNIEPSLNDFKMYNNWQPIEVKCDGLKITGVVKDAPKTGTTEEAKHYQVAEVQPIEIMQATMSKEQFEGYLLGNVIKYALRINHKGQKVSDAEKCNQYADWLRVAMNGGKIVPGGK